MALNCPSCASFYTLRTAEEQGNNYEIYCMYHTPNFRTTHNTWR